MESTSRSIAKAASYRLLGSVATAGICLVLTGSLKLSLGAGALDVLVKIAAYYIHERIWNLIPYGRERRTPAPEYEI
jgi:uncharacterized membrane protein